MFTLAIVIGIYSYLLAGLGWLGVLTWPAIWIVTIVFLGTSPLWFPSPNLGEGTKRRGIVWWGLFLLIIMQTIVNLVGALGPELGFDALWYHLPIPRIWLASQKIFFIGGDLYYSAMPKLIDMLYVWGETPAKLMHLTFGLLSVVVTYKLALRFTQSKLWSLLAGVIFYSNLVVGWQSITAYIDLGRTFFEVLAFYLLVDRKIYKSAIILGLAMATKTIALGSLGILGMLVLLGNDWRKAVKFVALAIGVASPWYIFAWISTGNPVYPIFSDYVLEWNWTGNLLRLADPINPIYVMVLPVAWIVRRKIPVMVVAYCLLSFLVWYVTPRTGGGRFILPYLPVWSVLTAVIIAQRSARSPQKFLVGIVIAIAVISIGYRAAANAKYLPVLLGQESRRDFLLKYLRYSKAQIE